MDMGISIKRPVLIILLAFVFWLSFQLFNPVYADSAVSEQKVMIKFQAGTSEVQRNALIAQSGGEMVAWLAPIDTAIVTLSAKNQRSITSAMSYISNMPEIVFAEYDSTVAAGPVEESGRTAVDGQNTIPPAPVQVNDPDFNNSQRVYAPSLMQLNVGWGYTMGDPEVVVAVVDSGVNNQHPDLQGRVLSGYDFVNDDADAMDDHGHGTHVAGIIAASANNGIGSAGVCPACSILPVKVLNESNVGTWANVTQGILYAVDNGADIINLSLGGTSDIQTVRDAVNYALSQGVTVVAAAGNSRSDVPFFPAAIEGVIAVSGTRNDDTLWSLSNYGDYIDVAAPGYAIYSTYGDLNNYYGGYTFMSGTSMASPHVAGLAGLIVSQDQSRSKDAVYELITQYAADLGDPGKDAKFGYGRIDAGASLAAGAPQPQATASLAGSVWHDDNVNGLWEEGEQPQDGAITVHVFNSSGTLVGTSSVTASRWQIGQLYADTYTVRATVSDRMVFTSNNQRTLTLSEGQQVGDVNFGLISVDEAGLTQQVFLPAITGR